VYVGVGVQLSDICFPRQEILQEKGQGGGLDPFHGDTYMTRDSSAITESE
jgi:hypothetical protein